MTKKIFIAICLVFTLGILVLGIHAAVACHGDCCDGGGGGNGCAQACDEGCMGGYPECRDSAPGDGYLTGWGTCKRDGNDNCGGWGNCIERHGYTDFGCNGGYHQCGDGCCEDAPPCVPNAGQACQSAGTNACGQRGSGTIQCNGSCNAPIPPNTSCPPPTCGSAPANVIVGQTATLTAAGGVPAYNWNTGGGMPGTGSGATLAVSYGTPGTKTATVTDSVPHTGTCTVNVCAATYGQPCQSAPSACGQTNSGTYQCDGSCNAVPPPISACPAPGCTVNPATAQTGATVTATATGNVGPYSWNTGGGVPAGGAGNSIGIAYATQGTKTVTVTDLTLAKSGTCQVSIGNAFVTTGTIATSPGKPRTIDFSTAYTVRIKVWDQNGQASAWSTPFAYSTKPGPWPKPYFIVTPTSPPAKLPAQFTDKSLNSPTSWIWDFGDGEGANIQNPTHTYAAEGAYNVLLRVANGMMPPGQFCSVTKTLQATKPIPIYKEVRPGTQASPSPTTVPRESPINPNGGPSGIQTDGR